MPAFLNKIILFFRYNVLRDIRSCCSYFGLNLCANDRDLASFKNRHQGKRCFVIGNGPSLKIADLDRLQNEITFACNKIYLAFPETNWRPTYYAVEDTLVVKQNYYEIERLHQVIKFFPERFKKIVPSFRKSLYFNMNCYMNYPGFRSMKKRFSKNANLWIYHGQTVVFTMMQLAFFMGVNEIYLIGIDFNFSFSNENVNDTVITSCGEQNHFHPDYRKAGEKWFIPCLDEQEKSFAAAQRATYNSHCKIYDATRGGKLTIFPKINLDDVLSQSKDKQS